MGVDLLVGRGCCLLDVIGDLHTRSLRASETHLILAKIRVDGVNANPSPATRDPEILMADLENHLGDTLTHYLTVQVTYRHSGFTKWESNYASREGTYVHSTFMQTEARVAIKRHDPLSAWSPRSSQTVDNSPQPNALNDLIERHLPAGQAMNALAIINRDRTTIPFSRNRTVAVEPIHRNVKPVETEISARIDAAVLTPVKQRPAADMKYRQTINGPFARLPSTHVRQINEEDAEDEVGDDSEETDPARKIWASMREVSRGGRSRHPRKSVSADHYYSVDDGCSPGRLSSAQSLDGALPLHPFDTSDSGIELERNMIKEVALKNKRSVGTETLRSMAPSIPKSVGKGKPGAIGLGLVGGRWNWGSPWW